MVKDLSEPPIEFKADRAHTKELLRRFNIRADKRLGQNFLVDPGAAQRIIKSAELRGTESVIEIGSGIGSLTLVLSQAVARVVAIEIDKRLIQALEWTTRSKDNIKIVQGDFMRINLDELGLDIPYTVVANIPYYLTSALIRKLIEAESPANRIVLTIQKEVAERVIARPGQMNMLALSVQVYGQPSIRGLIRADSFYPQPQVDSNILRIDPYKSPAIPPALLPVFFQITVAGFGQRRKQLKNALASGLGIPKNESEELLVAAEIDPGARAQELDLKQWECLSKVYLERGTDPQSSGGFSTVSGG